MDSGHGTVVVAKGNKVKGAIDVTRLKIYPVELISNGSIKTFKGDYLGYLEGCLMGEGSMDERIGHIHELLGLYKELKEGTVIYVKTSNNFIRLLPVLASTLNHFFVKNEKTLDGMLQMFNGLEPGKTVHLDDGMVSQFKSLSAGDSGTPPDIMAKINEQMLKQRGNVLNVTTEFWEREPKVKKLEIEDLEFTEEKRE